MFDTPASSLPLGLPGRLQSRTRIGLALLAAQGDVMKGLLDDWSHPAEEAYGPASRCARALLRHMLREEVKDCRDRPILRDPSGRPVLEARAAEVLPAISLSHAGGFVAAAHGFVSRLGLDIEYGARERDIRGIAELAFGPGEQRQVEQYGPVAFYRIWTGREALAKATGRALAQLADRRDYFADVMSDDAAQLQVDGEAWTVAHARPSADLFMAIAWQDRSTGP